MSEIAEVNYITHVGRNGLLTLIEEQIMNFKEELEFQLNQGRAMFDGFGQFMAEALVLGATGIAMAAFILAGFGLIAEVIEILG